VDQQIIHPSFTLATRAELPLYAAKRSLVQSLEYLLWKRVETPVGTTIRVKQRVANTEGNMYPLFWLRSLSTAMNSVNRVYFLNLERTVTLGGYYGGSDKNDDDISVLTGEESMTAKDWDVIVSLPPSVRFYDGGHFDPLHARQSIEWEEYGGHYYILPSVELRIEKHQMSGQGSGAAANKDESEMVATLAVNIHTGENRSAAETIASALKQWNHSFNKIQRTPTPTLLSFFYPNNNNKAGLLSPFSDRNYE